MLSVYASLLTLAALFGCPYWRHNRHFIPLYLWAIYCSLGNVPIFGIQPLSLRWPMGCAFGAVGLWWFIKSSSRTIDSMLALPVLLIAWALASTVYSEVPQYSLLRAAALVPMFLGSFLGVSALIREPGGLNRVVACLGLLIGIQALLHMGAFFTGTAAVGGNRFHGAGKATGAAHHLAYALPFVTLWITRTVGWARFALVAGAAFMTYLLVITRSRAGILGGLLVAPLAYHAILRRARGVKLAWTMAGCAMLGAILWLALANEATLTYLRIESTEQLLNTRADRWGGILAKLSDSPWIGHGYGTVRYFAVDGAMTWTLESRAGKQINTHNEFLSLLYDLGVVPTMMLAAFLAAVGWRGLTALIGRPSAQGAMLIACVLSWLVDAVDTMTHDGLLTIGNPASTWFWIKSLVIFYGCPTLFRAPSFDALAATSTQTARRQQRAPT